MLCVIVAYNYSCLWFLVVCTLCALTVRGCVYAVQGWRPRSDSLIFEHQIDLERLTKVELVNVVFIVCVFAHTNDTTVCVRVCVRGSLCVV